MSVDLIVHKHLEEISWRLGLTIPEYQVIHYDKNLNRIISEWSIIIEKIQEGHYPNILYTAYASVRYGEIFMPFAKTSWPFELYIQMNPPKYYNSYAEAEKDARKLHKQLCKTQVQHFNTIFSVTAHIYSQDLFQKLWLDFSRPRFMAKYVEHHDELPVNNVIINQFRDNAKLISKVEKSFSATVKESLTVDKESLTTESS